MKVFLHLLLHNCLVLRNGAGYGSLNDGKIAPPAFDPNMLFHEFDQPLDNDGLNNALILSLVSGHMLS